MKLKPFKAGLMFILSIILALLFLHSPLLRVNKAKGVISGTQEKGGVVAPKPKPTPKPTSSPQSSSQPTRRNPSKSPSRAKSRQVPCEARSPTRGTGRERSVDLGSGVKLEMVEIPPGSFCMGSTNARGWLPSDDTKPVHRVTIGYSFYMGKYEVTQAQWRAVMGNNPSHLKGDDLPVEQVSWNDAQKFILKLNRMNDGYTYRLPTESEWEYACRSGNTEDQASIFDEMEIQQVGTTSPNTFGLFDMLDRKSTRLNSSHNR
jgi:formylglycine-generating enzyme required for sulfatase activity